MDVGMITSTINAAANSQAAKETTQADVVKKYGTTGKTIGQPKLSEEAKKYYEELKAKYQNMDFILVSKDMKEMAKANAGSFANPNKMVCLIDEEKIERMAVDENYRIYYENLISSAQQKLPELQQALSNSSNILGFGVQINDNGTTSFFAVMSKSFEQQAKMQQERLAEKKAEEKAAEKKAQKKEAQEKQEEKRIQNKEAQKALEAKKKEKNTEILTGYSIEELLGKIEAYNYSLMADSVLTESEKYLGTVIDFKG